MLCLLYSLLLPNIFYTVCSDHTVVHVIKKKRIHQGQPLFFTSRTCNFSPLQPGACTMKCSYTCFKRWFPYKKFQPEQGFVQPHHGGKSLDITNHERRRPSVDGTGRERRRSNVDGAEVHRRGSTWYQIHHMLTTVHSADFRCRAWVQQPLESRWTKHHTYW